MLSGSLYREEDPPEIQRLFSQHDVLAALCADPETDLDERAALLALCRAARQVVLADGACLVLRQGEEVHYAEEDSVAPLWAGQSFPIADCISGWSISHKAAVVIPDVYKDPRIPIEYYRKTFVKSLAMQPFDSRHPIGAIGVYWREFHEASPRELWLLERLASVAAITISHARLRSRLESLHASAHASLAVLSHELRSYLNAILGWTDVLRASDRDERLLAQAVDVIERNAKAQAHLVDELLDATRMAAGQLRLDLQLCNLGRVVNYAIEATHPGASAKRIEIKGAITSLPLLCRGDALRLQQVVTNLLTNAIKFSPDGSAITVNVQRSGTQARVSVIDQGRGIDAAFMPRLFESFQQAQDSDATVHGGLGLGLALCRQIVELHGGTITASSPGPGRGTTFTFEIPLLPEATGAGRQ